MLRRMMRRAAELITVAGVVVFVVLLMHILNAGLAAWWPIERHVVVEWCA